MKAVASAFDCGTERLKTAVRAEMSTGTVMFVHFLAAAVTASRPRVAIGRENILMLPGHLRMRIRDEKESPQSWSREGE